MRLDSRQGRR